MKALRKTWSVGPTESVDFPARTKGLIEAVPDISPSLQKPYSDQTKSLTMAMTTIVPSSRRTSALGQVSCYRGRIEPYLSIGNSHKREWQGDEEGER